MDRTERVELTMLVMVEDVQGRVLMQNRTDSDWGGLCFPGGHIEPGESVVHAAVREVYEETGLKISGLCLRGLKQFPINGGRYLVFLMKASHFSGTLQDSSEGRMYWLRREEFSQFRMSDNLEQMLSVFDDDSLTEMFWSEDAGTWKLELL